MRAVLAVVAALVACAVAQEVEEGVLVGTVDNFDQIISDNEFVLAEFYAPWCGHCKALSPEYAKAATALADEGSPIKLVKVDATIHEKLGERFEVRGYPTLKWFKNGKALDYGGGRTSPDILAWVKKKSGPAALAIATVADAASKIIDPNEVGIIGFFSSESDAEAEAFKSAAGNIDLVFGITTAADVASEYGVSAPAVVLFKKFDEGKVVFEGEFTSEAIAKFVSGNQLPLLVEFSDAVAPKIFGGEIKTHLLLFADKAADNFADLSTAMTETAKENRGDIIAVHIDTSKEDNARILEFFGLDAENVPAVRLINMEEDMAKYKPESSDITAESLKAFAADYKSGNLKKHLMSQETPADWDAKPVKVLTGGNFADVAKDTKSFALVEFYAPWCGHCKQLVPVWDKLAEKFEGIDNVVIAKLDSTANELEDVQIQSFPTIKLFPAGDDQTAVDYEGARTLKGFVDFINEKAGTKVELAAEDLAGEEDAAADEDYGNYDEEESGDYAEDEAPVHEDL